MSKKSPRYVFVTISNGYCFDPKTGKAIACNYLADKVDDAVQRANVRHLRKLNLNGLKINTNPLLIKAPKP